MFLGDLTHVGAHIFHALIARYVMVGQEIEYNDVLDQP